MASVPGFLTGPLERVDPAAGSTQLLVLTTDAESALAIAEAALRMTGPAGIELLPITSARRATRLIAARPVLAAAGSPRDMRDLVRGAHLKLDKVSSVVLAWADEILAGDPEDIAALEAVMSELPKDAARIVVTSRNEGRVNAFAERYLRRAHRDAPSEEADGGAAVPVKYLTVSPTSRASALRRLLDDLDPPSAVVIASDESAKESVASTLRLLGYGSQSPTVRLSDGAVEPATYAVIFYELPTSRSQLAAAAGAGAVTIIVLVEPREIAALKRMSGGDARPFSLSGPGTAARERENAIRRELVAVIDSGLAAREILSLEPLLERHDGIEIAAAALRLLEKERILRAQAEQAGKESREHSDHGARPERGDRDRRPRDTGPPRGRDSAGVGGRGFARGDQRGRGPADSARGPRREGPPRGPRKDNDRRPPREGYGRPRRDRE